MSPHKVWFEHWAGVFIVGSGVTPLPVLDIAPVVDADAFTYTAVTITLAPISDALFAALDPRAQSTAFPGPLRWWSKQWSGDPASPTLVAQLPPAPFTPPAQSWIRSARRLRNGQVIVTAAGGESMLADKRRLAGTTLNTGATTVQALVGWALGDVFGGVSVTYDTIVGATALPAGDRRLLLPGESNMDLIQPELDAIGCRLYDRYGATVGGSTWAARSRDIVAGIIELASYDHPDGAPAGADPIVTDYVEELSRDGTWADGVLVKYDQTATGGGISYQASPAASTRGRVITRTRAAPAGNAATQIAGRTIIRGRTLTVDARCRYDVQPGYALILHTPDRTYEANIRAVEFTPAEGTMSIRAQTGDTIE